LSAPVSESKLQILAISGSLRAASVNSAVLRAASVLAPPDVAITIYSGLGQLPPFNPDLEIALPAPVVDLRRRVQVADGLLIASPEYAHGVSGVLKNALDWLVSGEEFVAKPLALLNASARATIAYCALLDTLTTMAARIIPKASLIIPLGSTRIATADILADAQLSDVLRTAIVQLARAIAQIAASGNTGEEDLR
jgi:chromate reductase, NAD(P)H dehydrogenase (quinone)